MLKSLGFRRAPRSETAMLAFCPTGAVSWALVQSYRNIEIIVVDDGSTDDSAAIAAQYPRVRCMLQTNAGVAAARNAGFRQSRGDYLVFLDHDDRLLPNAVASNLQCLQQRPA